MASNIHLSSGLDIPAIRKRFDNNRRTQIRNILTLSSAELILKTLTTQVDWNLVFNEGDKTHVLKPHQVKVLTPEKIREIRKVILENAQDGFQYMYNNYNIYNQVFAGENTDHFLHRFHEFLNSPEFLNFVQEITGVNNLNFADSQATAYGPGHFLTRHNDKAEGETRKFAFVFNFTRTWQMDWGGILQFLGEDGNVEEGFVPSFNALNIFEVPQAHTVSYVVPYVPEIRYAITGWIRENNKFKH